MKILVLLKGNVIYDSRSCKEIGSLQYAGHEIVVFELPPHGREGTSLDNLAELRSFRLFTRRLPKNLFFWTIKFLESTILFWWHGWRLRPDAIHCHTQVLLLAAVLISKCLRIPLIYDMRDMTFAAASAYPKWFWLRYERLLVKMAKRVIVTDAYRLNIIADKLKINQSKMHILTNYPRLADAQRESKTVRDDFSTSKKLLVYTGMLFSGRYLEKIIKAMAVLGDRYALAIIGLGTTTYVEELKALAKSIGVDSRMVILSAVNWSEVSAYISSADCAFSLYEKNSLNNYYCSPTKLFDAMIVGVPVLGSDNPLIKDVIEGEGVGECVSEVTAQTIAEAIKKVLERDDLTSFKANIAKVARRKYNWEAQEAGLLAVYEELGMGHNLTSD